MPSFMTDQTDNDFIEFKQEATDLLDQSEVDLLALDKGATFESKYNSIFRVFHSLKGAAGMLGLEHLQKHMHFVENLLSTLKSKAELSKPEITFFLDSVDAARKLLDGQTVNFEYKVGDSNPTPASTENQVAPVVKKMMAPKVAANNSGTVYLIDDEADVLDLISEMLASAGIQTRCFIEPELLFNECKANPPDLIITDLKMPLMSGTEVIKKVREFDPDVPIIVVSGYITTENLLNLISFGIFSAIEKPFNEKALITYSTTAIKQQKLFKLVKKSLNLLMYQFSDLEYFLKQHGKEDIATTAKNEINSLMSQWNSLRQSKSL